MKERVASASDWHVDVRSQGIPLRWIWACWSIPSLLSGFNTFVQYRLSQKAPDWHWLVFNSLDWYLYAVLTPFVFHFSRRHPLIREKLKMRLALHTVAALALCIAWAGMGTILRRAIFPAPAGWAVSAYVEEFLSWVSTTLPFGVGVYYALIGIEHSWFYFREVREREIQAAQLKEQLSSARLSALQMQLNPHFLFNSLNAIVVLVREKDTAGASRMLELLSDMLRQVLRDREHEIPLAEELEFVRQYLAIEEVRFSDRLRFDIQVDVGIEKTLVPVLLLQPLVENAVRHGIAARADAGLVEIVARRDGEQLLVIVRDGGDRQLPFVQAADTSGEGIGLKNTRARLQTLYGDAASLRAEPEASGGFVVTVRLPYREQGEVSTK